jgi:dipeptidyl aminopeptidase/acylaminoacyl peptidase
MPVTFKLIPILAILTTLPSSAQELVGAKAIFVSDHKPVVIEQYNPATKGPHPAVMVVHGGGGPDGDWRRSGLLESLTAAGYSAFVPHYFDGKGGRWEGSDNPDQFFAYIRTLNDASRYIARQTDVKNNRIALIGFSLGGYLVLGLAEEVKSHPPPLHSPEIKAVVEMYGGMPGFAVSRMATMPPSLILHGEDDDVVSVTHAYEVEQLLQKKGVSYEIKMYSHQGHGFSGDALKDANKRTVSFLKIHLQ